MAGDAAQRADLIVFVTDSDLNETEHSALVALAAANKPIIVVLNKIDLYSPEQRGQLLEVLREDRLVGTGAAGASRHHRGRSARGGVRDRIGRRPHAQRVAQAGARRGGAQGADARSAGARRAGAAGPERRHVRRRQERPHRRAADQTPREPGQPSWSGASPSPRRPWWPSIPIPVRRRGGRARPSTRRWS